MEKVGQFASALGTLGMADPYDPETRKPHCQSPWKEDVGNDQDRPGLRSIEVRWVLLSLVALSLHQS